MNANDDPPNSQSTHLLFGESGGSSRKTHRAAGSGWISSEPRPLLAVKSHRCAGEERCQSCCVLCNIRPGERCSSLNILFTKALVRKLMNYFIRSSILSKYSAWIGCQSTSGHHASTHIHTFRVANPPIMVFGQWKKTGDLTRNQCKTCREHGKLHSDRKCKAEMLPAGKEINDEFG